MVPLAPTAHASSAEAAATPYRSLVVPELCDDHVAPPSVVRTMTPPAPTAQAAVAVGAATPFSAAPVPEVWMAQVAPPSVVLTTVPAAPTAQPVDGDAAATASRTPVRPSATSRWCRRRPPPP